jgi:hypothetical protein
MKTTLEVEVPNGASLRILKEKLFELTSIPTQNQKLLFKRKGKNVVDRSDDHK